MREIGQCHPHGGVIKKLDEGEIELAKLSRVLEGALGICLCIRPEQGGVDDAWLSLHMLPHSARYAIFRL